MPDAEPLSPPVAPVREQVRTHHGDEVVDPYAWMSDSDSPDVLAYLEAENAYAEVGTAHLSGLRADIVAEIKARVVESDGSVPVASGPWWYYTRTIEGASYPIQARIPRRPGESRPVIGAKAPAGEQIIVDGNVEADGHEFFALGGLTVSSDHARLAFSVDTTGDERFAVTVRDLASGAVLDQALTGVGYGVEFSRDASAVYYLRVDDTWRPYQLWRHTVGDATGGDELLYEEADARFWMGIGLSRDERWLIVSVGSKTTSEVRLLDLSDPAASLHLVAERREGVEYDVEPADDHLLIVHNRDNPDSDLALAPLGAVDPDQWETLLTAAPGERFLGVDAFDSAAVLSLRSNGATALRVLPRDAGRAAYGAGWDIDSGLAVHSISLGDNPEPDQEHVLVVVESYTTPRRTIEVALADGAREVLKTQEVPGYDPAQYREARLWATAPDGTQVPVSLVMRADLPKATGAPLLLTAYGAYEISNDPYFSVARCSLLDRGVAYAVAHVRGGGELGRAWYEGGKLAAKRTTFTDTLAALDTLVALDGIDAERVGIEGGSAGGLLVGAVLNLAPHRFRFAHAAVPFVDALNTMLDPSLPLTVGEWDEWGNPLADAAAYATMRDYSPYENIAATTYPAILATASLNDTRVEVTEPAKWVARLRARVTNDPATRPIYLRTEMTAGHGGRSGRYAAWEQTAWEWAVLLDELSATQRLDSGAPHPGRALGSGP